MMVAQSNTPIQLPPGYTLDQSTTTPQSTTPSSVRLPPGYTLDKPASTAATTTSTPPDPNRIVERGDILPLGRTASGKLTVAWPETVRSLGRGIVGLAEQGPGINVETGHMQIAAPRTMSQNLTPDQLGALMTLFSPGVPEELVTTGAGEITPKLARQFGQVIKPSAVGRRFSSQARVYYENMANALHSIVRNKGNLVFGDPGAERVGQLPQSLDDFGQAIAQTKQRLFAQYDALAKQANDAGLHINTKPVVDMIDGLLKGPVVQTSASDAKNMLVRLRAGFLKRGWLTSHDAQEVLQNINSQIKASFRSPNPHDVSKGEVLKEVARQLNADLDYGINRYVGPGYQDLRREYGALTAIEQDVVKRAIVVGRQEYGGGMWGRLSDAAALTEGIIGLATGDWRQVVSGGGIKLSAEIVKRMREPNRVVRSLFEQAENILRGTTEVARPNPIPRVAGPVAAGNLGDPAYGAIAHPESPQEQEFYSQPGTM